MKIKMWLKRVENTSVKIIKAKKQLMQLKCNAFIKDGDIPSANQVKIHNK